MLYFCSRGRENRGDMSRETFIIHEEGGSRFITIRDAKNNCENDTEQSQGGVMMESSNNPRCPVSSFFIFFSVCIRASSIQTASTLGNGPNHMQVRVSRDTATYRLAKSSWRQDESKIFKRKPLSFSLFFSIISLHLSIFLFSFFLSFSHSQYLHFNFFIHNFTTNKR